MKQVIALGCVGIAIIVGALGIAGYVWVPKFTRYLQYGYADLPPFIERRTAEFDGHDVSFLVARFAANDARWALVSDSSSPKSIRKWRETLGAQFVVNGSYFTETYQPSGFYVAESGSSTVPWPEVGSSGYTFGVNVNHGRMHLVYLPQDGLTVPPEGSTFLSFPTLVVDGASMVKEDSGLHARRTVLAQTDDGTTYTIVSESGEVSLYQMAEWLAEQPEHFRVAGNIDGGPSTGLSAPSSPWDIELHSAAVPNVIVIR